MSFVPWNVFELKTGKKSKTCEAGWTQSADAAVELWAKWPRSTDSGVFNSNSEGSKQGGFPEMSEAWAELEVHWSWSSREVVPSEEETTLWGRAEPVEPGGCMLCWVGAWGVSGQVWPSQDRGWPIMEGLCPERSLQFLVWLFIIYFYWSRVDLQRCANFRYIAKWFQLYIHISPHVVVVQSLSHLQLCDPMDCSSQASLSITLS